VKIEKSLIKCDSLTVAGVATDVLPLEGGEIVANLTCKGNGVAVEIPADAQSWLGVVASTVGTNPTVTFRAQHNTGGDRNTTVTFKTTDGKKTYTSQATINQKGAIIECPIADFLAAEVGDSQYRLTGVITELYASDKQGKSFYIADYSGQTLIYRAEGFIEAGAKVGDVVTVVGKRGAYKDSPQMVEGTFESLDHVVTPVTIAEFLTKADDKNVYYMVTGTLDEIANDTYGNVYLKDGDDRLYVYGCYPGWGATGDARKGLIGTLGLKVGDKLTVIGVKSTYKDTPQVSNGIYFSHVSAN
jgi:DNA/RNA endonuclease YhcR with UshA esterase domain